MREYELGNNGLQILEPVRFEDSRGFFCETWNRRTLRENGINVDFVQDNHSLSISTGTLRGLHFQRPPHAQAKLVRCSRGRLLDVVVDIRQGSPDYARPFLIELSFVNGKQLFIPAGFLHGFITLEPNTEIAYKCSDYYDPECDSVVRYDDPELGIVWPLEVCAELMSKKDSTAPFLNDIDNPFYYEDHS